MKFDSTEIEKTFAVLTTSVSTYVMNVLAQYHKELQEVSELLEKTVEENEKLKKSIDALIGGTSE